MIVDVIIHVPSEGLGLIAEWLKSHQCDVRIHDLTAGAKLADIDVKQTNLLISMGGPMSANDTTPVIFEEQQLMKIMKRRGVAVLGICLGAQQLAKALGAKVYSTGVKEVGFLPIETTSFYLRELPEQFETFHWHGEQFELPKNAERLFKTNETSNQGFIVKDNLIGLQFHPEITREEIEVLTRENAAYISEPSETVQSATQMQSTIPPKINQSLIFGILDKLAQSIKEVK